MLCTLAEIFAKLVGDLTLGFGRLSFLLWNTYWIYYLILFYSKSLLWCYGFFSRNFEFI